MKDEIVRLDPKKVPHHKLAGKHREMSDGEYESLKHSIEHDGQLVPVILYKNKLVDGRHRQKALIELGIDEMKCISLPGNISLKEVEMKVIGTEKRRSDTASQRAIRAYLFTIEHPGSTLAEAGVEFGVDKAEVSRAKKVHEKMGIEKLNMFYKHGYLYLGDKRYTQLRQILKAISPDKKDGGTKVEMSDIAKNIMEMATAMKLSGDVVGLALVEKNIADMRRSL